MARKFEFRLQKVLKVREILEELVRQKLDGALIELNETEDKLVRLQSVVADCQVALGNAQSDGCAREALMWWQWLQNVDNCLQAAKIDYKSALDKVEQLRTDLVLAWRRRKLLEKLKEKRYKEFLYEELRGDQASADDDYLVTLTYNLQNA